MARNMTGQENEIEFEDEIVAVVEYRDGTVVDTIKKVK
ncbi:MAG: citrate lyase subunit alpha [Cetobacterium somerae]